MMIGVGADLVETERVRRAIERWGERFLLRAFTPEERSYCQGKSHPHLHFAARFAAKEAVLKALGGGVSYLEIEVLNDSRGVPLVRLPQRLRSRFRVAISLSHTKSYALAFALVEEGGRGSLAPTEAFGDLPA